MCAEQDSAACPCLPGLLVGFPIRCSPGGCPAWSNCVPQAGSGFGAVGRVETSTSEAQLLLSRVLMAPVVVLTGAELGERQALPGQSHGLPPRQPGSPQGSIPMPAADSTGEARD